jgi:translation initiation factor IF-2
MRARGAQSTDVVVLVVAADDGVMPQTREAIDHARAAEVPIVVAINKCDKPDAQPDRIRQELSQLDLLCEEWGGKTIMKEVSAKTGQGVDELMEHLALETEMLELRANPDKAARGVVVESEISRGQGPVAWVLVQEGTLRQGDVYLAGKAFGRVRAMLNYRGEMIEEAGPATPVVVTGFSEPPDAGDPFIAMQDERIARGIATKRADLARHRQDRAMRRVTLEDFHDRLQAGEKHELNVVIKADVQGSVDVFGSSLSKIGNEEVSVRVVHAGVGSINESDVLLASASDAVIIGFHVTANARVQKMAEQEGVEVRTYRVIYEAIEDVRQALEGLLEPETREVVTGHAEVRQLFRSSAVGTIAGSYVTDGQIERNSRVRVVRDGTVVHEGRIGSLRRGKEDARSLQSGFECGITLDNFDDVKEGDVLEAFRMESVAKTLA